MVVFVFSRKRIDQVADNLNSLDLTTASEKAEIHIFVEQSVARLKGGDRRLPQILRLKQMLKRGLGVHHAGVCLLLVLVCRVSAPLPLVCKVSVLRFGVPSAVTIFEHR